MRTLLTALYEILSYITEDQYNAVPEELRKPLGDCIAAVEKWLENNP